MNKYVFGLTGSLLVFTLLVVGPSYALSVGQQAPGFILNDTQGQAFGLFQLKDRPLTILYFFDVESQSSQEGLLSLAHLVKKYPQLDMEVLAITLSDKELTTDFVKRTSPGFPVLLDDSEICEEYGARKILPTIYILGPGQKILEAIQGGGKTTEVFLLRLAERTLQRNKPQLAQALSEPLQSDQRENFAAAKLHAYAAMQQGDLARAEETFLALAAQSGQGKILGKEGLVMVYARKGEAQKALALATEVEQLAPERAFIHVIRGDIYYRQGQRAKAETEYQKAVAKREADLLQKALALNKLGQIEVDKGNYQQARKLYDRAVELDPYNVEALTNKGISYEKEGNWDGALQASRQALAIEREDTFAAVLAKNAEEMLKLQKDHLQQQRIDDLVKELSERQKNSVGTDSAELDNWTSGPMVMTFVDFAEKGGLAERDGLATVLTTQLGDLLNRSGRIKVVERTLVNRVLAELGIGTSALADTETALKIGRVLAAKLIATGTLFYLPDRTMLSLRLIDTETSAIQMVASLDIEPGSPLEQHLFRLNRDILETVMTKYPLQGYLVETADQQVLINLGERQGVVLGTTFEVLDQAETKSFQQKTLRGAAKVISHIEISKVEPELSYARILDNNQALQQGLKVREKIQKGDNP